MPRGKLRRHLSMPGLLAIVRKVFGTVAEPIDPRGISLADALCCGLAVFILKFPSLLQFDTAMRKQEEPAQLRNLKSLFKVEAVPSDTCMRERLDRVDVRQLRGCFTAVFAQLQRGKGLEGMTVLGGRHLLSIDGTGYYSSKTVKCEHCLARNHRDGTVTYQHQMLAGAIVHPVVKAVFPLAPEMILRGDGASKNDCERNAAIRFLNDFRREHPHLRTVVVQDGLSSNGPHIKLLRSLDLRFILVAKPGDHDFLFDWVRRHEDRAEAHEVREGGARGATVHSFRWLADAPINSTHFGEKVTFIDYCETKPDGRTSRWSWVTDLEVTAGSAMEVMRCARRRWAIENETFKTLKSISGYSFEHNFGHGHQQLSSVLATLAVLAFLIDQVQEHCCPLFRQALARQGRRLYLWQRLRSIFFEHLVPDWLTLWLAMARGYERASLKVLDGY